MTVEANHAGLSEIRGNFLGSLLYGNRYYLGV